MGLVYKGKCNNCGYEKDYRLNENIEIFKEKRSNKESLVKRLDEVNRSRLEQFISANRELKKFISDNVEGGFQLEFSYRVYRCEKCKYFVDKPYMELRHNGEKLFETKYNCKNCGSELIMDENAFMERELYNTCPECRVEDYRVKPKDVWE